MAKKRYEHGTICRIHYGPKKKPKELEELGDTEFVYIDNYASFNTYRCYPCDRNGEVKPDAPLHYIHKLYLLEYKYIPSISNKDLEVLIDTLNIFTSILNSNEVELDKILQNAQDLTVLSSKMVLIKNMERLK